MSKTLLTFYSRVLSWNMEIFENYIRIPLFFLFLVGRGFLGWEIATTQWCCYQSWITPSGPTGRSLTTSTKSCPLSNHLSTPSRVWQRNSFTVIRENLHVVKISCNTYLSHLVNIFKERPTTGHLITYSTTVSKSFLCNRCSSRSNTSSSSSFYFVHPIGTTGCFKGG